MAAQPEQAHAQVGDLVEARGLHGGPTRRGEVLEVVGSEGHLRYRVRWEDRHESIVFPADGVTILQRGEGERPS